MTARKVWIFTKGSPEGHWQWRELLADGTIVRCSEDISDYGKAVHDAIRNGFDPLREYWLIRAGDLTTYYRPDAKRGGERQSNVPPLEIREALRKIGIE